MGKDRSLENKLPIRTPQQGEMVSKLYKEGYTLLIFSWLSSLEFPGLVDEVRDVIASGRRPLVFMEIHGKVQRHCTPSDLLKLGVQLPPDVTAALHHESTTAAAHFDLSKPFQFFESSPNGSLSRIKENGSVTFPERNLHEGKWTIVDGLDKVSSGFEFPPKPPQTLQELDVVSESLRYVSGYDWTKTDSMKLSSSAAEDFDKLLPETYGADLDQSVPSSTQPPVHSSSSETCIDIGEKNLGNLSKETSSLSLEKPLKKFLGLPFMRMGSGPSVASNQGKAPSVCKLAIEEAVRKMLSQLVWALEKETMLSSIKVALFHTGHNINMILVIGTYGAYGALMYYYIRDVKVTDQHRTYISCGIDIFKAGIMWMPFSLGLLAVLLRNVRKEQSLIIAGGAFYSAVMGILWIVCSPLPVEYILCLAFSSSAILVVGVFVMSSGSGDGIMITEGSSLAVGVFGSTMVGNSHPLVPAADGGIV